MPPDNIAGETGMFGRKVLAVSYGGTLQLFGRKGATYTNGVQNWDSGKSWVRLRNHNSRPGENIFNLDRAVDWKPGDRVVVTTTDYLPGHSEEFEIINVDPAQPKITVGRIDPLTNQLPPACAGASPPAKCKTQYAHNGDLYPLDNLPDRLKINVAITNGGMDNGTAAAETRAAVALLTRSIRIVSGGNTIPATQAEMTCRYDCFPVSDGFYGGQTMVLEGFKDYQVQGVEFYQLGQGGRKARYPVHFHLARKTPSYHLCKRLLRPRLDDPLVHPSRDPGRDAGAQRRLPVHRTWLLSRGRHRDGQQLLFEHRDLRPRGNQTMTRIPARCRASWREAAK